MTKITYAIYRNISAMANCTFTKIAEDLKFRRIMENASNQTTPGLFILSIT